MNQTISQLQQQFPLSSKKLAKKVLSSIIPYGIVSIFIGGFLGVLLAVLFSENQQASGVTMIIAPILGFVVVFLAIILMYVVYMKMYIKNYYYAGEDHFITIKKGVFAPAEIHVQWQKIQDVYVDQDILDRIMGLYDVHIASATAASGIEAHIDGVDKAAADGLKKFLLDKMSGTYKPNNTSDSSAISSDSISSDASIAQSQNSQAPVSKINFSEEISSDKYPLSGKWFVLAMVGRVLSSVIFLAFVGFIFFEKTKADINPANNYILLGYGALFVVMTIWNIISLFLWRKNYKFNFTDHNIYYREGVIGISEKNMPYSSIQDVTVRQGVLDRVFGLGKVVIENAAQQSIMAGRGQQIPVFTGVMIVGVSIEDANKITNILKETVLINHHSNNGL